MITKQKQPKTPMNKKIVENYIDKYYLPTSDEKLEIKEVWENRFRVNIRCENNKIKASFFIRTDGTDILYCNPPLKST